MRVFADTFYWIALTDSTDQAHDRAARVDDEIVTTDEVLSEYLTFFSAAPEFLRREVASAVEDILRDPGVKSSRRLVSRSSPASNSIVSVRTKATASRIAFRCRQWVGRG